MASRVVTVNNLLDGHVIRFAKGQRKLEVMGPHLDRLASEERTGVATIGVAQEF